MTIFYNKKQINLISSPFAEATEFVRRIYISGVG